MNKNIKTEIAIGIILLVAISMTVLLCLQNKKLTDKMIIENTISMIDNGKVSIPADDNKVFCPQDAKQCPGGSFVSRKGSNCEFESCPNDNESGNSSKSKVILSGNLLVSHGSILDHSIGGVSIIEDGFIYSDGVLSGNGDEYLVGENFKKSISMDEDKSYWRSSAFFNKPNDDSVLIFSIFNPITKDLNTCENKIYSYDIKSGNLVEFYQQINENNSPWKDKGGNNCRNLEVFGLQGSKLILIEMDPESNPEYCANYWSGYNFYYLELSDVSSGLNKFNVPSDKLIQAKKESEECYQELNK